MMPAALYLWIAFAAHPLECPPCPEPRIDVRKPPLEIFGLCMTGPIVQKKGKDRLGLWGGAVINEKRTIVYYELCRSFDVDADADVDLEDYAALTR